MVPKRFFLSSLIVVLLGLLIFQGVRAAVDLAEFIATPQEDAILIEWETATELDNAGFYVARNTANHPPYLEISSFIPAEGSGVVGATYQYLDEDVEVGTTYYYVLEIIDTSNNVEYSEVISATIGLATATPTPTPTSTATNTPTRTNTPDRSRTPTRTPIPSSTYTPQPPTFTPTPFTNTPTITKSPTITPSPTLFDPPEIVLNLPATDTPIPVIVITATFQPTPSNTPEPESLLGRVIDSGALLTMGAICLVVLIWAAIAVGIFIYIQKRNS